MTRIWALGFVGVLLVAGVTGAGASDTYSSLPYVSRDGWQWDSASGAWRNPRATRDPNTRQLIHEMRIPSSTTCCDRTGLSFPDDAANKDSFDSPEEPKARRKSKAAADTASRETDAARAKATRTKRLRDLQEYERRRDEAARPDMSSLPQDGQGGGAAQDLYGGLSNRNAADLEEIARRQRRDTSADPTLPDVVGSGLALGAAANGLARVARRPVPRANVPTQAARGTAAAPQQRVQGNPNVPYTPYQSDISGTK